MEMRYLYEIVLSSALSSVERELTSVHIIPLCASLKCSYDRLINLDHLCSGERIPNATMADEMVRAGSCSAHVRASPADRVNVAGAEHIPRHN